MNEVMKLLTVISTIFILTFAGDIRHELQYRAPWNMPELNWYWGYPLCLAAWQQPQQGLVIFFWRRLV